MMTTMEYHNPVLLIETVDGLNIKPDGIYVDVTFGGGGHSKEILKRLGPNGKLFGFDQDEDAFANALPDERFVLIPENFRYIKRFLRFHGVKSVDGILADLGVSSHQFDVPERGFSTRFDADLDMRMSKKNVLDAFYVTGKSFTYSTILVRGAGVHCEANYGRVVNIKTTDADQVFVDDRVEPAVVNDVIDVTVNVVVHPAGGDI